MTTIGTTIATIAAPVKNLHLQLYETNVWNAVTVLCGQLDCDDGTL